MKKNAFKFREDWQEGAKVAKNSFGIGIDGGMMKMHNPQPIGSFRFGLEKKKHEEEERRGKMSGGWLI